MLTRRLRLLTIVCLLITGLPLLISAVHFQRTFIIVNHSMVPALYPGDLLITHPVEGAVSEGAVVVFESPIGGVVAHRVIDRVTMEGNTYYVTRGDANEQPDSFLIPEDNLIGIQSSVIPKLGLYFLIPREAALITTLVLIAAYVGLSFQSTSWSRSRVTWRPSLFRKRNLSKTSIRLPTGDPKDRDVRDGEVVENESSVTRSVLAEERVHYIQTMLSRLVTEGDGSGEFIIFENPDTGKFVQLLYVTNELLCDVPCSELSREEERRIKKEVPELSQHGRETKNVSYQKWFNMDKVEDIAEVIERVFTNVFELPPTYMIASYSSEQ